MQRPGSGSGGKISRIALYLSGHHQTTAHVNVTSGVTGSCFMFRKIYCSPGSIREFEREHSWALRHAEYRGYASTYFLLTCRAFDPNHRGREPQHRSVEVLPHQVTTNSSMAWFYHHFAVLGVVVNYLAVGLVYSREPLTRCRGDAGGRPSPASHVFRGPGLQLGCIFWQAIHRKETRSFLGSKEWCKALIKILGLGGGSRSQDHHPSPDPVSTDHRQESKLVVVRATRNTDVIQLG